MVCGVMRYYEWQKVGCFLCVIYKDCLGIRITNVCGQHVAIVLSDCIKGLGLGLVSMQIEGFDNVVVVETVAENTNGVVIHSISNVLHVTNVVRRARHGQDIDTVFDTGSCLAEWLVSVCNGDIGELLGPSKVENGGFRNPTLGLVLGFSLHRRIE